MSKRTLKHVYRIFGISPEKPEGHEFASDIPDLQDKPELWDEACPYTIPKRRRSDCWIELT
jgi:hypothetical protein